MEPSADKLIFVSYSHRDSGEVLKYIRRLEQDSFSLWYDENVHHSIWSAAIEGALEKSSVVILFVSPDSLSSNNVFNEISFADNAQKSIFCVYLSETDISSYPGWRLMLTKCQAFMAYRDGEDLTYSRLKKCMLEHFEGSNSPANQQKAPSPPRRTDGSKDDSKKKAKILCIQKKYAEAEAIYDGFIEEDIMDMDGYMGHIRVQSENYRKFEGKEIDEAIQIAKDVCDEEDLSQFDADFGSYIEKRAEYFEKQRIERQKAENERFNVGNVVTFGQYWQHRTREEGKTPVEWIVLKREKGKALLLSKYCIACKQYTREYVNVTWETCNVRKWLNQKFINDAFTLEEQERILTTSVSNKDNVEYETKGGNDTSDKLFLLSIDEAENLLTQEERRIRCTDYAKAQGIWVDNEIDAPYWWLRSPGGDLLLAAVVHYRGKIFGGGLNICVADTGIRPAFWLSLDFD